MLMRISIGRAEELFEEGKGTEVVLLNPDGTIAKSVDGNRLDFVYHVECGGKFAVEIPISFSQEELQLLYAACMSYGDKLAKIKKNIPNEGEMILDELANRAKDSWDLARKIIEYMEG